MKRLLESVDGIVSEFHYDPLTDVTTINRVQDAEPVVERNKALQASGDGYTPSRDMRHVASIPLVMWEQWNKETGGRLMNGMGRQEKAAFIRKKLNDSELRFLRTSPGKM